MTQLKKKMHERTETNHNLANQLGVPYSYLPIGWSAFLIFLGTFVLEQLAIGSTNVHNLLMVIMECAGLTAIAYIIYRYVHDAKLEPSLRHIFDKEHGIAVLALAWITMGLSVFAVQWIWLQVLGTTKQAVNQSILNAEFHSGKLGMFDIVVTSLIFAPMVEEFAFRYLLMKPKHIKVLLPRWARGVLSALLFASIHVLGDPNWPISLTSYLCIGTVLTFVYYRYQSYWLNFFTHAGWNAIALINMFVNLM